MVVIQETSDSFSSGNLFENCEVQDSGSDGIQIQGDSNKILGTTSKNNGGYGIHLCLGDGRCVAPGADAVASDNMIETMLVTENALGNVVLGEENGNAIIMDMGGPSIAPKAVGYLVSAVQLMYAAAIPFL